MAVGEIGMSLKDFYSITYNEYHYISKGYMFKDEREWQRMRLQTAFLLNIQMDSANHLTPEELIRLPSDIVIDKKKDLPSKEDFERLAKEYGKINKA